MTFIWASPREQTSLAVLTRHNDVGTGSPGLARLGGIRSRDARLPGYRDTGSRMFQYNFKLKGFGNNNKKMQYGSAWIGLGRKNRSGYLRAFDTNPGDLGSTGGPG